MKKIISLVALLFIYMLSASAPVYAGDEKVATEETTKAGKTDQKDGEEEEPDCD